MRYVNNLRGYRDSLTQWDICKAVDIPPNRYQRLEKGHAQPTYDEARRLAAHFNVGPDALFPVVEHARAS